MTIFLAEEIQKYASEAEAVWGKAYGLFDRIIQAKKFKVGAEVGVAYGGHAEAILNISTIDKLYGVDPYLHMQNYHDSMNFSQDKFDELYIYVSKRLARFGDRYEHIRKVSRQAADQIPEQIDFVYIDADHSYKGVWGDLCTWFPKVRVGGIIGGHDYNHVNLPEVQQAVDEFFRRFDWIVTSEGHHVWWVEKRPINVSFFIPAYNCAATIEESVDSIMDGNFGERDEFIICNDDSTDNTLEVLERLKQKYQAIQIVYHRRNKGGGAARNTAIEHTNNPLLFCLDSDNVLAPESVPRLKDFLVASGADAAAFQGPHYFKDDKNKITHKWTYRQGLITLADCLAGPVTPGASGNYMFTKESWIRAGGYPEFAGLLDSWGFGFRQLATMSKMMVMPDSYYFHRYGHDSYWVREAKKGKTSLTALQILLPFLDIFDQKDVDYIMSRRGRYDWFENKERHPIKLKTGESGKTGIRPQDNVSRIHVLKRLLNLIQSVTMLAGFRLRIEHFRKR